METAEYIPDEYDPDFNYDSVIKYEYLNGLPVKATDNNGNITIKTYDKYGNVIKTTTTVVKDDKTSVSINESTYDISGRILSSKSDNNEIYYTYDAAGRTLLTDADGNYQRTVYDNYGRVIQEISNDDYKPEKDNLPNTYTDTSVGQRYFYDDNGSLVKDINDSDIETRYTYSEVGTLYKKSFDIYDYYYQNNGICDKIDVNGVTAVSYEYGITQEDGFELEDGETLNKVTYANGYTDYQLIKNNTVMAKYANNADGKYLNVAPVSYGYITQDTGTNKGYSYSENETTATKSLKRTINLLATLYEYSVKKEEDKTTITENHFDKEFKTVVQENSVDYTTPTSTFSLTVNNDETSSGTNILKDGLPLITSEINYDENANTISKTYSNGLSFSVAYDDKGNIISDERNSYEYDKYGELIQTTGAVNSSYTYDGRGNLLTKTVNGETTEFEYSNEWLDQLTAVNGTSLTYDVNGNLLTYGDAEYSWSRGRQLDSVTDGENSYSYTYDTNGIRASKKVNGRTTEFNVLGSKILAQNSIDGEMYFQYSSDELIGFCLNDAQYFYIKNPNGDIVGVADYDGNLIAQYEYDEWGKLLSITTAEEGNEEQLKIATANPFRYRGYYYDNETGYYYLHSRYYNPEWGRFINAEDFNYLNTKNRFNLNAYMYSWNSPIVFEASKGTEPQISININDILSFIKSSAEKIKNGLTAEYDRISKLFNNWSNAVHARCKAIADKISYFFKYPEAVLNTMFSATSKVMSSVGSAVRFKLIEFIRSNITSKLIEVKGNKLDYNNSEDSEVSASLMRSKSSSSKEDHDSILMAIFQGLFAAIELDWINEILEFFGSSLNKLAEKTYEAVERISLLFITTFNVVFDYLINVFSLDALSIVDSIVLEKGEEMALTSGSNLIDAKGIGKGFGAFISIFNFFLNIDSAGSGAFTKLEDNIMNVVTLVIDIACLFVGPVAGMLIPLISNFIMDVSALRIKGLVFMY